MVATTKTREAKLEFGGTLGVAAIMIASHALVYYLWISLTYYHGTAVHPASAADLGPFARRMWGHIVEGASPTGSAALAYFGFLAIELVFASILPGPWVKGLPVPSERN